MIGLNIKVDIHRPTSTTDTGWNVSEVAYSSIATYSDVRARISTLRTEERESLQAIGINVSTTAVHRIFFDAGTDVLIKDHIKHDSKVYEVVSIEDMDKTGQHLEGFIVLWQGVVA